MIKIRLVLQAFYREFLSELPIRTILHRGIERTVKASITFRAYLTTEAAGKSAMKNKKERGPRITGEWPLFRMNILIS